MPGSLFEIICPGCGEAHEISTGAGYCFTHAQHWSYEQVTCPSCQRMSSQPVGCHFELEPCSDCGGAVNPWPGRVFLDRAGSEPGEPRERIEGPCPACGAILRESDAQMFGLWD